MGKRPGWSGRAGRSSAGLLLPVLACLLTASATSTEAAPIRHRVAWGPRSFASIQAASVNGFLPQTPFINYLHWRRDLAPARFDHYHPRVGPLLALDSWVRLNPPTVATDPPTPPVPPAIVAIPPTPEPGSVVKTPQPLLPITTPQPLPQQTPEPGSATIALGLIAAGFVARRWGCKAG